MRACLPGGYETSGSIPSTEKKKKENPVYLKTQFILTLMSLAHHLPKSCVLCLVIRLSECDYSLSGSFKLPVSNLSSSKWGCFFFNYLFISYCWLEYVATITSPQSMGGRSLQAE